MRTRNRSTILGLYPAQSATTFSLQVIKCGQSPENTDVSYGNDPAQMNQMVTEHMVDSLGKSIPHGCIHRRWFRSVNSEARFDKWPGIFGGQQGYQITPSNITARDSNYYCRGYESNYLGGSWNNTPGTVPTGWVVDTSDINEDVIINDLLESAQGLKADVLLNIVEANQAWPAVKSLASCLPQMANNWKRIRSQIVTASSGYLAWKFGVSPILSDINNIVTYLPKIGRDLKRHNDGDKIRVSRLVSPKVTFSRSDVTDSIGGTVVRRLSFTGRETQKTALRYVLVVEPRATSSNGIISSIDFAMRRFASSPASLAWEKIPFSFVADWFVDLRSSLRMIDSALGVSPFKVVSLTKSLSYDFYTDLGLTVTSPCDGSLLSSRQVVGYNEYRNYERSVLSPNTSISWKPRFGKNQAAISAALIAQKLGSLRARR